MTTNAHDAPGLRILHVEDEPSSRLMLADLLRGAAEVEPAASAEAALALLERRSFDATFLDWMLPGIDGGQFLRAVREHGRAGRVVVLTAVGTVERAVQALRAGAYQLVLLPFDPRDPAAGVHAERWTQHELATFRSARVVEAAPTGRWIARW